MKDPARHGYFVGEKSAVIYWLCEKCVKDDCEVLARVTANLSGRYREMYYSIVCGDLDATEDWRARVLQ